MQILSEGKGKTCFVKRKVMPFGFDKKSSSFHYVASVFFAKTLLFAEATTFFKPSKQIQTYSGSLDAFKKMSEIMKNENAHNKLALGNRNDTSSHCRINCGKNPVPVGEIVKHCVEQLKKKSYEYQ